MRRIVIFYKRGREDAALLAQELTRWLEAKGLEVFCRQNMAELALDKEPQRISLPPELDLVVVLGGDGTLLSIARLLENRSAPIIGVNLGGLGFLTEISRESCYRDLEQILDGHYEIENRMRLQVSIQRQQENIFRQPVLNDVVINKGALARIVDLQVYINDRYLTHYRADGLIVATPTGSTAYNLSAGGPIVYPTTHSIILTPICPFTLTNRPIILPPDVTVQVRLGTPSHDVALTCDGQVGAHLNPLDRIDISHSPQPLSLVKPPSTNYFDILRTKLKWGQN